ncbi:hypothetical protein ARAM_007069 [Aspergillus rambellii]|uniref:Amine oxidase domain-containing protein n=1 Tax=Aspergillus rambellii TaxID=308745 RepID=A0A0F8X609_9EURO|nr:hypothetical protein ARAM_007069 [Aspergillus rambellii]
MQTKRRDVAVVGTGMAGLVTAYLLHNDSQQRFRVRLMDQGTQVSLAAESVRVPKSRAWVDIPMRAFAGGFYQNLVRMYDYLGVCYQSQPFLFHFSCLSGTVPNTAPPEPSLSHASNFHGIPPIPHKDIVPWLLQVLYVLFCYVWFTVCCFFVQPLQTPEDESLDDYLRRIRLPRAYVTSYLLPMISSVCTCSHHELLRFPASDILTYKLRTHRQPHFVVSGGVRKAQDALLRGIDVHLGTQITKVTSTVDGVLLTSRTLEKGTESTERFDLIVLAVSPDIAAQIFEPSRDTLQHVPTTTVCTVAHTDFGNILTRRYNTKSSINSAPTSQDIFLRSTETITEAVHSQSFPILVTTNPVTPIDPAKILRSASFTRVLRSPRSRRLLKELFWETDPAVSSPTRAWRNGDGGVYLADFPSACAALLNEVLITASLLDSTASPLAHPPPTRHFHLLLDVGIGCGDQSIHLLNLRRIQPDNGSENPFLFSSYVGLTLVPTQAELATRRITQHRRLASSQPTDARADIFCADAASPSSWGREIHSALSRTQSQSHPEQEGEEEEEKWLLALDTLYHFRPSRTPLLRYACSTLHASFMAFDLVLADSVSFWEILLLRLVCWVSGTPWANFLTRDEYEALLVRVGYESSQIVMRDISADVFSGIAAFLKSREAEMNLYGMSIGKFKAARVVFDWWARKGIVRGVIVVARR